MMMNNPMISPNSAAGGINF